MDPREQIAVLSQTCGTSFVTSLSKDGMAPLTATGIDVLQVNLTRRCNLSCKHCHVDAGPARTEVMSKDIMENCLDVAGRHGISTVDITGGAPETHPLLSWFLKEARSRQKQTRIIVRSNLVILLGEPYRSFPDLYAQYGVEVAGSVPDYRKEPSEKQRGPGSFDRSIEAIHELNRLGYGKEGSGLVLDLVHNPCGAFLPASQASLDREYKRALFENFGVVFNRLFCFTNCPVGRYLEYLIRSDNLEDYFDSLLEAYNPAAARNVMCRTLLSVGWDGTLYDCDFNQMLGLRVDGGAPSHIKDFDFGKLRNREIVVHNHCYACTAGAGSSCQGATIAGTG